MVLTPLAILIAALVGLAIASTAVPRSVVTLGTAGLSGAAALLVLVSLLAGAPTVTAALPIGPPGGAMQLAIDPLGAAFLLLLLVAAVPCAACAEPRLGVPAAAFPASLAAATLTVLAADAFGLSLGLAGLGVAGWLLLSSGQDADAAGPVAPIAPCLAAFAVVCLVAALALAAPQSVSWLDCDYAAIRSTPPEGWRALAVMALTVAGSAALAGLPPFHAGVRLGSTSALFAGVGASIGIYLLFRVLLDLCGTGQPIWWGVVLLLAGVAAAVFGTWRALFETTLDRVLAVGSLHQTGLAVMSLGVALLARAGDLPQAASLALAASWLLLVTHALCRTLLLLCAEAAWRGAGTRRLDRLGGLVHRMPVTVACAFAGLFGAAMLPPGLGFAGFWLLFQSLLGAVRVGGLGLQVLMVFALALAALSVGLAAIGSVRLAGVAFLGRPRTPRTAAADEVPRPLRRCLIGLAALTGLLSLFPGLALFPATQGLARLGNGSGLGLSPVLKAAAEAPGYAPVVITALLAVTGFAMLWLLRRLSPGRRREPAWSGGFAPPPPWLPFGDPTTQAGAASFTAPLRHLVKPGPALAGAAGWLHALPARLSDAAETVARPGASGTVMAIAVLLALAIGVWLAVS